MQARTLQKDFSLFMTAEICISDAQQTYKMNDYSFEATMFVIENAGGVSSESVTKKEDIQFRL